ncbi:protein Jumonji-like isoform X1 [Biomphalaria glabrata]|uniref:Protein Jumonji-like isoform X1 n=1 Tax=Biomphalaria glabrata TaxID=6526 RepID=A0A9U8EHG2_BIOGL|nr:protein Jumonji-like isoform X1 [Biomphalaria glabrata]XP_055891183.1 protein Jumonji-like isoform X1 [Biomphalaria glabrata]XP_055891184.1 protein Jumonji-like isoform X1 [Biomphalaria glabrata]
MVGRHNSISVTKRSLRNAETTAGKRPRRNVQSKLVDDTVGLSRQEEQELNKALYASLQENRKSKSLPGNVGNESSSSSTSNGGPSGSSKSSITSSIKSSIESHSRSLIRNSKTNKRSLGHRHSLRTGAISNKYHLRQSALLAASRVQKSKSTSSLPSVSQSRTSSTSTSNVNLDESSQDSSTSSANGSKSYFDRKIHAQRKFAQGCSLPGTPTCTPVKSATPPSKMMSFRIPKTEDFLTFLCLRGTSALPPHLNFFNYSREELASRDEGQTLAPTTANKVTAKPQRESTPESSSTSSEANNEEVAEAASVSTPSPNIRGGNSLLAKRSAARASAGTPETARGIVSLRQGLQRKVSTSSSSSSLARFPVSSPSHLLAISSHTNCAITTTTSTAPRFRNKFYFTPEKPLSPPKASGVRPGEFTPPSLFSSTRLEASYLNRPHTFSPLVHSSSSSKVASLHSRSDSPSSRGSSTSTLSSSASQMHSPDTLLRKGATPDFSSGDNVLNVKRSTLGAFTPVRVRSSGHHDSPSSSNKDSSGRNRAGRDGGVRSARKNLLDKLTSVVHQHSRHPRTENQTRVKAQNLKRLEPKIRSNKTVREKSRKLVKKSQKEMKTKRRISLRLSCKTEGRSRRIEQNCEAGKDEKKQEESDGSHDNKFRRNNQAQKKRNALKTRQPYKIHPLERVRTRGYNLLLASQLAVKRAKREKALIKKKVNGDTRHKEETVEKVVKNVEEMDKLQVNSVKKMQLSPDVSNTTLEENKQQSSDETKRTLTNSKSKDLVSSCQNRERKESLSNSPKRTPPKKAKLSSNSSPPPHTLAEDTVPVFHPTEAEFMNPLTFISKIQPIAEPYGMCRIIPPASWKLDSNKISDDVRFTPQVQQIHRLHKRWGPNVQHTAAINQHLLSENANITTTPQIGGVQIDLPQLYRLVEESGGPKIMSDKKHWARIADIMNIPKQAMDRTVRLYDIYCHHVFPYFTLSKEEKHQLEEEVKAIYELQTVEDEAITKGKSMPVSWFSRIARNVQSMWFKDDPTASQVETEYWKIVDERTKHVSVQCGHINTRAQASAFPTRKDSAYSRHPWNLNNIPESASCLLKYLGPVSGISIPTLHMGMLFSTSCWSTDPHCLPYIQYLHTGSDIIWYCIPKSQRSKFRTAMLELAPSLLSNKPRWLKEDCVMVNPSLLKQHGVKVHCCVHSPRQFVVVFPGAYTATISCGYNVSESVHFVVSSKWLPVGMDASFALTKSGERELFSMCALLCGLMQDDKVDAATLSEALPLFSSLVSRELEVRTQLHAAGLRSEKRSVFAESPPPGPNVKKRFSGLENEKVCEICDRICYLSMVLNEQDEQVLCLEHGLKHVQKKKNLKLTRLFLRYNQSELETMLKNAKEKLTYLNSKAENCPPSSSNISNKSKSNNKQPI